MGEPINIGMSLNLVRRTRENWWGIGFGIFAILLAVVGFVREWTEIGFDVQRLYRAFYLPVGIGLFVFFYLKGYEMLVKKTKVILYTMCGIIALEVIILLLRKLSMVTQIKAFEGVILTQEELNAIQLKAEEGEYITHHDSKDTNYLKDILPQYYKKNYRIAYWIIKYGWIIGVLMIVAVSSLYISLTVIASRIMNQLAKMLSISCSICLLLQFVFYLLSNLGYLYGNSVNLPLISDGLCSILVNIILFGCILGAYRYDYVGNHWDYSRKVKCM